MRNRMNKAFKIESHFEDNLIPVIRNFDTAKNKSNINKEMMMT